MSVRITAQAESRSRSAHRQPLPGVGPWRFVRLLGHGQWTSVYQAHPRCHEQAERADYAVKVPKDGCANRELAVRQLQREALVAREVQHPHLVCVLSAQVEAAHPHVVMPYLVGATLREVLRRRSRVDIPHALWLVRQTAEALFALHGQGWLHGDVKPENVFVAESGHVTLLDLGFARRSQPPASNVVDSFECSPGYAPPEVFHGQMPRTFSGDTYSLGIVLYEAIVGRRPFDEQDATALAAAHLTKPPPDARGMVPALSLRASRLLRQMLAKDPLRRPDMDELTERLYELEIETFDARLAG